MEKIFKLANLNGKNGFVIKGNDYNGRLGYSVAGAGDINKDGIDDIIVGSPLYGKESYGQAYVVFGSKTNLQVSFNVTELNGSNGFIINGSYVANQLGQSVDTVGDINGDGYGDVVIGSQSYVGVGRVNVVFGSTTFSKVIQSNSISQEAGFEVIKRNHPADDNFACSVAGIGDINGDRVDDMAIGDYHAEVDGDIGVGITYVVFGSRGGLPSSIDVTSLDGNNGFTINGLAMAMNFGFSVAGGFDLNGDRISDFASGAVYSGAGYTFVIFGSDHGFSSEFDLGSLNGENGFKIDGINPHDEFGHNVGNPGDINGDGIDDIIISTDYPNGNSGAAYIIYGKEAGASFPASISVANLDGSNGFVIPGKYPLNYMEYASSIPGDVNGDGVNDIILCASGATPGGESYVIYGSKSFPAIFNLETLDGMNGFVIQGIDYSSSVGDGDCSDINFAGDVNGDGVDDIIIGAQDAPGMGPAQSGEAYIVYGEKTSSTPDGDNKDWGEIIGGAVSAVAGLGFIAGLIYYGKTHGWCAGSTSDAQPLLDAS